MFKLKNPIQDAIRDPKKVQKFFEDLKLVPFAGTSQKSSHSYLKLLCDINRLSPSASACKRDIASFSFDGDVDIIARKVPGLAAERRDLAQSQKEAFATALIEHGIDFKTIQTVSISGFENQADTGNKYIYVRIATVAGISKVHIESINPLFCAYLWTEEDEPRTLIIVRDWDTQTWKLRPPIMVETEDWMEMDEPGVIHRMFHFKSAHSKDGGDWYGRPSDEANSWWKFTEFAQGELTSKISGTELVSKGILAFEGDPPEEDEDDTEETKEKEWQEKKYIIRKLTTNRGSSVEADSLAMMEYQNGTSPPKFIKLEVNRDVKYNKFALSEAKAEIYSGYGWFQELTGATQTGSGIGSNILIDLFKVADQKTIQPLQEKTSHDWDIILGSIWDVLEKPDLKEFSLKFPDAIEQLIQRLMPANDTDGNALDSI